MILKKNNSKRDLIKDDISEGYENLRNLVLNYLGNIFIYKINLIRNIFNNIRKKFPFLCRYVLVLINYRNI